MKSLTELCEKILDSRHNPAKLLPCMIKILQIVELVVAIALILSIIVQQRGSGLGGAFGSQMAAFYTRRGIEKFLYFTTIILGVIFVLLALATVYLSAH